MYSMDALLYVQVCTDYICMYSMYIHILFLGPAYVRRCDIGGRQTGPPPLTSPFPKKAQEVVHFWILFPRIRNTATILFIHLGPLGRVGLKFATCVKQSRPFIHSLTHQSWRGHPGGGGGKASQGCFSGDARASAKGWRVSVRNTKHGCRLGRNENHFAPFI